MAACKILQPTEISPWAKEGVDAEKRGQEIRQKRYFDQAWEGKNELLILKSD